MKNNYSFILIILTIILLLAGVGIILYRQELLFALSDRASIPNVEVNEYLQEVSVDDTLDLEVLNNKKLETLKDQVKDYSFENVCQIGNEKRCTIGTAMPFETAKAN